jgi:hypothetical protein
MDCAFAQNYAVPVSEFVRIAPRARDSCELAAGQELVERGQRCARVVAAHADAEAVPRDLGQLGGVDVGREREHAGGLHEPAAEAARRLAGQQAREADAAALRGLPLEVLGPAGEELGEDGQVGGDDRPVAGADPLPVLEGDRGQVLARTGVADRRVVLAALQALEQRAVAAGQPADPQPGQPVGL